MTRFPSTPPTPLGPLASLGRVNDSIIGQTHPGLRPNTARSALEDEVNCQLVDVPGPVARGATLPFNVHSLNVTGSGAFEAELAAQARPPGSPRGPPEVPVCARGPNQVCRLDDIRRTQGAGAGAGAGADADADANANANAGVAYTDTSEHIIGRRDRPRDDRQRGGGTHLGMHVAVQLKRRFLCASSGRSGHETRSVVVRLGEGDGGLGYNTATATLHISPNTTIMPAASPRTHKPTNPPTHYPTTPLPRHFRRGARWRGVLWLQVVAFNRRPALLLRDVPRRVSGRCRHC